MRRFWRWYYAVEHTYRGLRNVYRWAPVIWRDRDFDWSYLAEIMEYKLRRMGGVVNARRHRREMLVCAELLRRLRADDYWQQEWDRLGPGRAAGKSATLLARADQAYLGRLIGRHLSHWWY